MPTSEAEVIAAIGRVVAQRTGAPLVADDDCAFLRGHTDIVTTDALVEGRHFDLRRDTAFEAGAQAAVANLSDLAASGARAGWLLWSLVLPADWTLARIEALTAGFAQVAGAHGARIVGGNLSRATGPAVISVTAGGPLAGSRPLLRSGARPGDSVWVSGPLGDAALGYLVPDAAARRARHRWRPHLAEASRLAAWGKVGAAMDISDGLTVDAARIARASGVAVHLDSTAVPVGPACAARGRADLAVRGGEDYVLLFTAAERPPIPAWRVGHCAAGAGLWVDGVADDGAGFDHFGSSA